jgi:hypothetical protein
VPATRRRAVSGEGWVEWVSEFSRVLRGQVGHVHDHVHSAWSAGNDDAATRGASRLSELLELAQRHGIDTARWLDPAVRALIDLTRDAS